MSQAFPTVSGPSSVSINGPLSGFGELEVVSPEPTSQVAFVYGLNPQLMTVYTYGAGASATSVEGEAVLASGTAVDGYARLVSKKVAKYRAGQATMAKWTARFPNGGFAGSRQMTGLYNIEAGYQFGYSGTTFGILYTASSVIEVQTLTITVKAGSATNVTVTLDGGAPVVVPVTNGANTNITAYEISRADYSQAAGGWDAEAIANVVYFTRRIPGPAGASTFAPGTSGAVGAFTTVTTGVVADEQFIPQTTWNIDTFTGTGGSNPSGVALDPAKGNVYGVQLQYLGYGDAKFYIVNPFTGLPSLCHIIRNANARVTTNLRNPSLYLTWDTRNTGTGTSREVRGASGGAFVEGPIRFLGTQFAALGTKTCSAGVETPIITLRASTVFGIRQSSAQLQIDRFSVSCDGTKTVNFRVYKNAALAAAQFQRVDVVSSAADYDSSATSASVGPGTLAYVFSVQKTGNATESVSDLALYLQAGETLTITAQSVNATDVSASIIWVEDV